MNSLLALWAKLGNATWPDCYHPVLCHLIDVGQVACRLWEQVYRPQVQEWVTTRLGLTERSAAGKWLAFWTAAAGQGKSLPAKEFSLQMDHGLGVMFN